MKFGRAPTMLIIFTILKSLIFVFETTTFFQYSGAFIYKMDKILFFFTSCYPNAPGEVFVENEIRILENHFDKIIIICSVAKKLKVERYIPRNAEVHVFNEHLSFFQKLKGLSFLFSGIFWQEIKFASQHLKIKFHFIQFKILYVDLIKGNLLSIYTQKILTKFPKTTSFYFYSYWSDYKAVACAFSKEKNPAIKAFARCHRWDIYFYANTPKYLPLRKFIFDHLDAIYCIAEDGIDYLKNVLKFEHSNFHVAKLGTYNDFLSTPYHKADKFVLVSCSNLIQVKRVPIIIEALSQIRDIPIHWIHFGSGPLMEDVTDLAIQNLTQDILSFEFRGTVPNEQIMDFYNTHQVDLFINVSESEGIPVSIMEAISFGIPVLATAVGGTPEIVKDKYNGFLLPADSTPEMVAEIIKRFYFLPEKETLEMRENAFKTWDKEFNAKKNYTAFSEMILAL
jgi:colanic acid/amylovoran biosynthesis glycosyltransferase